MIYCPKCETANRDGSRFCNECGERLGSQTQVKCPHCGVLNPVQNVFCSECSGRLLSSPTSAPGTDGLRAIKGLSLPTKASLSDDETQISSEAGEGEGETPAWLRKLGASRSIEDESSDPAPADSAEDVPEWLRDLRESLPEEPRAEDAPPGEIEEETIPDWPAGLQPEGEPQPSASETEADDTSAEVPDWLAKLQPEGESEPSASETEADDTAAEVPDWLAELQPEGEPEPFTPETEVDDTAAEVPDWLAKLQPEGEPEPFAPETEVDDTAVEVPDWLAELQPEGEPEPSAPETEIEDRAAEVPDWLAELQASEEEVKPAPLTPETEAEEVAAELPDWLAELPSSEEELEPSPLVHEWPPERPPSEVEAESTASTTEATLEPAMVPEWLEGLQPEGLAEPPSLTEGALDEAELPDWLVPSEQEEDEPLVRAEIPDWLLALKPRELRDEAKEEAEGPELIVDQVVEETGLLAGLRGTLPAEMLIAQPRASTAVVQAPVIDTPQARLFAKVVSQPPATAPKEVARPRADLLPLLPRWIIYIALIAAVTLPLLLEQPLLPRDIEPNPAVIAQYDAIASLSSGAQVLVAFDYDPTHSGEMDLLAQAIVGHLMDQEARIVALSLLPAGPATAQSLLDEMAAEHSGYADGYGQSYVNLGFLPGQTVAVRLLGQSLLTALRQDFQGTPLTDLPVMEGVSAIEDFDLVIELAAEQSTLRWWIEQAGAPFGLPLGAGVSAAIEPVSRSYYETEPQQLAGLVAGVSGAATYESLLDGQDRLEGTTASRLDSQLGGHGVLILMLLVGGGLYLVRRGTGRES